MSMVQYIIDKEIPYSDVGRCLMPVYADKYLPSELEEMYSNGNLWAGNTLACGYDYGWFGERDHKKAVDMYRQLVRRKYPLGIANYGFALLNGIGVRKDVERGLFWTKMSADMGCTIAMSNLAFQYTFSDTMPHDYALAQRYARMAAERGDATAMNTLGLMYAKGLGFRQNYVKAFKYYRKAYEANRNPVIIGNLANCYRKGHGVERDLNKAEELMAEARLLQDMPF